MVAAAAQGGSLKDGDRAVGAFRMTNAGVWEEAGWGKQPAVSLTHGRRKHPEALCSGEEMEGYLSFGVSWYKAGKDKPLSLQKRKKLGTLELTHLVNTCILRGAEVQATIVKILRRA